jgi:transcriptional regulator with XRE-family HTH domain
LRIARAEAGMTLGELAEKSGVALNTISRIERGTQKPQAATLHKLARALDAEIGDLFPKVPALESPREWLRAHNAPLLSLTEEELSDHFAALYPDMSVKFADRINEEYQRVEIGKALAPDPNAPLVHEAYVHATSRYLQATELAPISTSYDPDDPEKPQQITVRFEKPKKPAQHTHQGGALE